MPEAVLDVKSELAQRFGSLEAMGVILRVNRVTVSPEDFMRLAAVDDSVWAEENMVFPGENPITRCWACADQVSKALPGRVQRVGFAPGENPGAAVCEGADNGHTFAIVDGRYIVDPWLRFFAFPLWEPLSERIVFDLLDPADHTEIDRLYAERTRWKDQELAEGHSPRIISEDIDEMKNQLEVMRAEIMSRIAAQQVPQESHRG